MSCFLITGTVGMKLSPLLRTDRSAAVKCKSEGMHLTFSEEGTGGEGSTAGTGKVSECGVSWCCWTVSGLIGVWGIGG